MVTISVLAFVSRIYLRIVELECTLHFQIGLSLDFIYRLDKPAPCLPFLSHQFRWIMVDMCSDDRLLAQYWCNSPKLGPEISHSAQDYEYP